MSTVSAPNTRPVVPDWFKQAVLANEAQSNAPPSAPLQPQGTPAAAIPSGKLTLPDGSEVLPIPSTVTKSAPENLPAGPPPISFDQFKQQILSAPDTQQAFLQIMENTWNSKSNENKATVYSDWMRRRAATDALSFSPEARQNILKRRGNESSQAFPEFKFPDAHYDKLVRNYSLAREVLDKLESTQRFSSVDDMLLSIPKEDRQVFLDGINYLAPQILTKDSGFLAKAAQRLDTGVRTSFVETPTWLVAKTLRGKRGERVLAGQEWINFTRKAILQAGNPATGNNWLEEAALSALEMAPPMIASSGMVGAGAKGAGVLAAGKAALATEGKLAAAGAMGKAAASQLLSPEMLKQTAFWTAQIYPQEEQDLVARGMDRSTATGLALASGVVQGLIENINPRQLLGIKVPEGRKPGSVLSDIGNYLHETLKEYFKEAVTEEGLQALTSYGVKYAASQIDPKVQFNPTQEAWDMYDQLGKGMAPIALMMGAGAADSARQMYRQGQQRKAALGQAQESRAQSQDRRDAVRAMEAKVREQQAAALNEPPTPERSIPNRVAAQLEAHRQGNTYAPGIQAKLDEMRAIRAKGPVSRNDGKKLGLTEDQMDTQATRTAAVDALITQAQESQNAGTVPTDQRVAEEAGQVGPGSQVNRGGNVHQGGQVESRPQPASEVAPAREEGKVQVTPPEPAVPTAPTETSTSSVGSPTWQIQREAELTEKKQKYGSDKYRRNPGLAAQDAKTEASEEAAALQQYPPGTELEIEGYKGSRFQVRPDGTLYEMNSQRSMGDNAGAVLRGYKPDQIKVLSPAPTEGEGQVSPAPVHKTISGTHISTNLDSLKGGFIDRNPQLGISIARTTSEEQTSPTSGEPNGKFGRAKVTVTGNGLDYNNPEHRQYIDSLLERDSRNVVPNLRAAGIDFVENWNSVGQAEELHVLNPASIKVNSTSEMDMKQWRKEKRASESPPSPVTPSKPSPEVEQTDIERAMADEVRKALAPVEAPVEAPKVGRKGKTKRANDIVGTEVSSSQEALNVEDAGKPKSYEEAVRVIRSRGVMRPMDMQDTDKLNHLIKATWGIDPPVTQEAPPVKSKGRAAKSEGTPKVGRKKKAPAVTETEPAVMEAPKVETGPVDFVEQKAGTNAPGVKKTVLARSGERVLHLEHEKYSGWWSVVEKGRYTGDVKGTKTKDQTLATGIRDLRKAKDVATRIFRGTFDREADLRFEKTDSTNLGESNTDISKRIKNAPVSNSGGFALLLRDKGWVTDGRMLLKVTDKDRDAILAKAGKAEGRAPNIDSILDMGDKAARYSGNAMTPIAYRAGDIADRTIALQNKDGKILEVSKVLHDTVMKKHPGATMYGPTEMEAVAYVKDGEVVGIVMPLRADKPDAHLKSLEKGTYWDSPLAQKSQTSTRTQEKKAALDAAFQRFTDAAKNKLTSGLDPELVVAAKDIVVAAIDLGITQFKEFVRHAVKQWGREQTLKAAPYLEAGWKAARSIAGYEHLDAPSRVQDLLGPTETPFEPPPRKKPLAVELPFPQMTGIKLERLNAQAEAMGMSPPNPGESLKVLEMVQERLSGWSSDADKQLQERAAQFVDDPSKPISVEDAADLLASAAYNRQKSDEAWDRYNDYMAQGDEAAARAAEETQNKHQEALYSIGQAARLIGTQWSHIGHIYQALVDKDGSAYIERILRKANRGVATEEDKQFAKETAKTLENAKKKQAKRGKQIVEEQSVASAEAQKKELEDDLRRERTHSTKSRGARNKIFTQQAKEAALERIRQRRKEELQGTAFAAPVNRLAKDLVDAAIVGGYVVEAGARRFADFSREMLQELGDWVQPHLAELHRKARAEYAIERKKQLHENLKKAEDLRSARTSVVSLAKEILAETRKDDGTFISRDELLKQLHEELSQYNPALTPREVQDLFGGYGNHRELSKEDLEVKYRDYRGESRELSKIDDLQQKIVPPVSGMEMHSPSDAERQLSRQVTELKKQGELEGWYHAGDKEQKLKGTLAAQKTRVENEIRDLDAQIASGEKIVRGKRVALTDEELEMLRDIRDERRKRFDEVFGVPELTDEQRAERYEKQLEAQIRKLREQLSSGNVFPAAQVVLPTGERISSLKAEIESLKADKDLLRKTLDPSFETNQKLAQAERQAERELAKLEQEQREGFRMRESQEPLPVTEKLRQTREKLQALRDQRKRALENEYLLKAAIAQAKRNTAKILERIANEDFAPKKRPEPKVWEDAEWKKAKDEELAARKKFAQRVAEHEWKNMNWAETTGFVTRVGANVWKAWLTSFDASMLGLQGGFVMGSHPVTFAQALVPTVKATLSTKEMLRIEAEMMADPDYEKYRSWGLAVREHGGNDLASVADYFPADRVTEAIPGISFSGRMFSTFTNQLRFNLMKTLTWSYSKDGRNLTNEKGEALARLVNAITFTWKPKSQNMRNALAGAGIFLWAPSMYVARAQILAGTPVWLNKGADARIRTMAAWELLKGAVAMYALKGVFQWLWAGHGDDEDKKIAPTDSDYYKVKKGDIRVDMSSGLGQNMTLGSRVAQSTWKSWTGQNLFVSENNRPSTTREIFGSFMSYKVAPWINMLFNLTSGSDVLGRPTNAYNMVLENFTPLSVQNAVESIEEAGFSEGSMLSALGATGKNVSIYNKNNPKSEETFLATARRLLEKISGTAPKGLESEEFKKWSQEKVTWNTDTSGFSKFLNQDQLTTVAKLQSKRRGEVLAEALSQSPTDKVKAAAKVRGKKNPYKDAEALQKAQDAFEQKQAQFDVLTRQMPLDEAEKALATAYAAKQGLEPHQDDSGKWIPFRTKSENTEFTKRVVKLRKAYQSQ